jgi:hypothetical protein
MLFTLLAALSLVFAPSLPENVPDTSAWPVMVNETFTRPIAADVVRFGGQSLKFIQTRNICPEELRGDCTYTVQYEFRRKVEDGKMVAFVQRYVVVGPTGNRDEGVAHFSHHNGDATFTFYYRKGNRWLSEERGTEECITANDFFMMLAERHQSIGF